MPSLYRPWRPSPFNGGSIWVNDNSRSDTRHLGHVTPILAEILIIEPLPELWSLTLHQSVKTNMTEFWKALALVVQQTLLTVLHAVQSLSHGHSFPGFEGLNKFGESWTWDFVGKDEITQHTIWCCILHVQLKSWDIHRTVTMSCLIGTRLLYLYSCYTSIHWKFSMFYIFQYNPNHY